MLVTSTCTDLLPGTQTPASMQGQLQAQGATTVLPNSSAWLQQALPQTCSVLIQGGMAQHTSQQQLSTWDTSAQFVQQVGADTAPQGSTSSMDVSRLRAMLQDVLRSLPAAGETQVASTASNSTGVLQQLQGPCAVLGMPQHTMTVQPAQPQPVYLSATGQQIMLVGDGPQPTQLQQSPMYACQADGSSSMHVRMPCQGVLGGSLNPVSTAMCHEMQANAVLVRTQGTVGQNMTGSSAYGVPIQVANHQSISNSNMQAACVSSAVLGPETPGCFTAGIDQAWPDSGSPTCASSSAGSPQLVSGRSQVQQQPLRPSSASPQDGSKSGNTTGHTRGQATFERPNQGRSAAAPATATAQQAKPAAVKLVVTLPAPWATTPLLEGLQQLWSSTQVEAAKGGCIFTSAERTAWHPTADVALSVQDLFDFRKLKYVIHQLDSKQQVRVQLIKRLHAVVDYGGSELRHMYFEVRCIVSEMLHRASGRIVGLVRLALALQEALSTGRVSEPAAAVAE